jgi:hypothetical protein
MRLHEKVKCPHCHLQFSDYICLLEKKPQQQDEVGGMRAGSAERPAGSLSADVRS